MAYNCPHLLRNRLSVVCIHLGHSSVDKATSDFLKCHCHRSGQIWTSQNSDVVLESLGLAFPPLGSSPPPRMTLEELVQGLVSRKRGFFLLGVEWSTILLLFPAQEVEGGCSPPRGLEGPLPWGTSTVRVAWTSCFRPPPWLFLSGETELESSCLSAFYHYTFHGLLFHRFTLSFSEHT